MKRSVKNIKCISNDDARINEFKYELRKKLGLLKGFDSLSKVNEKAFLNVSTLYKSLYAYEEDKQTASSLIALNKNIPPELYNKLLQTKIELEKADLLEYMQ